MRSLARYAATNAITRTMLSELLGKADFERIARSESLQGAWQALRKSSYAEWIPDDAPADVLGIEKILREATASRFKRSIYALRGKPHDVGVDLLARWEVDNLEFALRLWHGKDLSLQEFLTYPSVANDVPVYDVTEAETLEQIALLLRHTPYFEPVSSSVGIYRDKRSIFFVEMALEKDYYKRLLEAIRDLGGSDARQAAKIISAEIDMLNLSWLMRLLEYHEVEPSSFHEYIIHGPSEISRKLSDPKLTSEGLRKIRSEVVPDQVATEDKLPSQLGAVAMMESMVREMAVDTARGALAGFPFSMTCVFAFYLLKRTELKNLYTVFAGKTLGAGDGDILDRLYGLR
ncbi:MAG: V-type ATPase subunit [Candidatus Eisenbacteria bacterium]